MAYLPEIDNVMIVGVDTIGSSAEQRPYTGSQSYTGAWKITVAAIKKLELVNSMGTQLNKTESGRKQNETKQTKCPKCHLVASIDV